MVCGLLLSVLLQVYILLGGDGTIHGFGPLQSMFTTALWAIQITTDTPRYCIKEQAKFYVDKIKVSSLLQAHRDTLRY